MASSNDRISKVLLVAIVLCLVCSVVVSSAAVLLRDAQQANKALDMKRNILAAAGMLEPGVSVEEQFKRVETRAINFETGEFTDAPDVITELWFDNEETYRGTLAYITTSLMPDEIIEDEKNLFDRTAFRIATVVERESDFSNA